MSSSTFLAIIKGIITITLILLILGGAMVFLGFHPLPTTMVSGQVITTGHDSGNLHFTITGDVRQFDLEPKTMHPTPPSDLAAGTAVHVWVMQGQTYVLALQVTDPTTGATSKYTTPTYDDPDANSRDNKKIGTIKLGVGILFPFVSMALLIAIARRSQPRSRYTPTYMPPEGSPPLPQPGEIEYPPRY